MNFLQSTISRLSTFPRHLERLASSILLPAIVLLVTTDVAIRSAGAGALSWSHELLGLLLLLFFLTGLPYCAQQNNLIQVDLVTRFMPSSGVSAVRRISSLLSTFIGGLLAYHASIAGLDMYAYDDGMVTLPIPLWPISFAVSFLATVWASGQFMQIFAPLKVDRPK